MLTDYWVISQLFVALCAWVLVMVALVHSIPILRKWNPNSSHEIQLKLERNGYLVSSILRFVLGFQILSLIFFLVTVNNWLPQLIRGAMCATGILGIHSLGYPLLYLKIFSIFIYFVFLCLQYFDDAEPAYPLSPLKYYVVFPVFLVLSADTILLFRFFSDINPDLIATCCSVAFVMKRVDASFTLQGTFLNIVFYIYGISFTTLLFLIFSKKSYILQFLLSMIYVSASIYTLKYYFVKYVYGVLAHYCLFDLFLSQHHFVGYWIFGSYYVLLGSILFGLVYYFFGKHLRYSYERQLRRAQLSAWIALLLSLLVPMYFWITWDGYL